LIHFHREPEIEVAYLSTVKIQSVLILILAFCLPLAHAIDLPDLGESSRTYLSEDQEQALARSIMKQIYADSRYLDDPVIEEYLDNLGYRLVSHSPGNQRTFDFFVMRDPTINAFALPGAHIGVHTGLIANAENESELAAVLAHEISHVNQNHLYRTIANQERSFWPSMAALAVAILASRSNPDAGMAALAGTQALNLQNQLSYSRDFEREADRMGFNIMQNAGFDPHAMATFFERLQRANRLYDSNAPAYLHDHPLTSERIADIESRLVGLPYKQYPDSPEFQLIKARVESMQGSPNSAIDTFRDEIEEGKYSSQAAAEYGLALAYLRAGRISNAEQPAEKAYKLSPTPMTSLLLARVAAEGNKTALALKRYQSGLSDYPNYRPLMYGYAETLLDNNQPQQALDFIKPKTAFRSNDIRIWKLMARSYAMLGKQLASHRALAEALALSGNLKSAIEQINLGLKAGDGDFYDLSAAEARRKEWRSMLQNQAKE
jgi:predicted Zn-dependent protease